MKLALTILALTAAVPFSTQSASAGPHPGGGWDGNNGRVSVRHIKLLTPAKPTPANEYPGGGWDLNNGRVSVRHIKLLSTTAQ